MDKQLTAAAMAKAQEKLSELNLLDFNESDCRLRRKCRIYELFPEFIEKEINEVENGYRNHVWKQIHELVKILYSEEWPRSIPEPAALGVSVESGSSDSTPSELAG